MYPGRWIGSGTLLGVLLLLDGCATTGPAPVATTTAPAPPVAPALPKALGPERVGMASWYGEPHHGQKTSSGEIYDMHKLTAAHRTLPIGTRLLVTNPENGKQVEVRINDRGPFVDGRVLDVSYAAARALGVERAGVFRVRYQVVEATSGLTPVSATPTR